VSNKNLISSLDFFSSLNEEQIDILVSISTINTYSKDYLVHFEKQANGSLLFLLNGLAKAYKIDKHENEIFLHYLYENSLISDISNLNKDTLFSFSNVMLLKDSKVLSIDYKKFKKLFLDKGLLCTEFSNEIILKSQQLQSLINREFVFNSVAKVAMILSTDLDIFNSLKRAEISLMLHIQPETLSRVLNRFKRDELISSQNGKIIILDEKNLISVYEG